MACLPWPSHGCLSTSSSRVTPTVVKTTHCNDAMSEHMPYHNSAILYPCHRTPALATALCPNECKFGFAQSFLAKTCVRCSHPQLAGIASYSFWLLVGPTNSLNVLRPNLCSGRFWDALYADTALRCPTSNWFSSVCSVNSSTNTQVRISNSRASQNRLATPM